LPKILQPAPPPHPAYFGVQADLAQDAPEQNFENLTGIEQQRVENESPQGKL